MDEPNVNITAQTLGEVLQAQGWMLALAESCTGGMAAASITDIAGSSAWFDRGFVTYSNQAKIEMLDVPESVLNTYGAVSTQTAEAMAIGALRKSQANIAGAITGIAGPSGGSEEKPVGMVCFALAKYSQTTDLALSIDSQITDSVSVANMQANIVTQLSTQFFEGNRTSIREQACIYILAELLAWSAC